MIGKIAAAACIWTGLGTMALAAGSPAGTWQSVDGSARFEVTLCGDGTQVCARLVHLSGAAATPENMPYLNKYVMREAKRAVTNKWRGEAEYLGETVRATLTLVDATSMTINGCRGAVCQKFELSRR